MAGCGIWVATIGLSAQDYSSLTDSLIEFDTFDNSTLTLQGASSENAELTRRLESSEARVAALTQSLAAANSEAEFFRKQTFDLKLRMEALGLDSVGTDETRLEQRLLRAVSDLQIVTEEREVLADQIIQLSEAVLTYLKNAETTDFEARMAVEEQLRRTGEALGLVPEQVPIAGGEPAALTDSMIISFKEELGLVVLNVGRRHGAKLGMPFRITRGDNAIAIVRLINVRESISGAIVQSMNESGARFKIGDRARVDTQ